MSELQARRDAQTRAELSTVAIGLFADRGFVETTMADVAEAAGVSRRTVYRHYANKEDLIFEHTRQWMEVFKDAVDSRAPNESTRDVCTRGVLAVAAAIEKTKDDVLPGYGVVAVTPTLRARYARTNRDWLDAYTELFMADVAPNDAAEVLRVSLLAGALVGGTDRAVIYWFMHPSERLVDLTQSVVDQLESLW